MISIQDNKRLREFKEKQAKRQQELIQKQKEDEEKKQRKICKIQFNGCLSVVKPSFFVYFIVSADSSPLTSDNETNDITDSLQSLLKNGNVSKFRKRPVIGSRSLANFNSDRELSF